MKKTILLFVILLSSITIFGQQNLIPNPSFEDYECIPHNMFGSFDCVKEWYRPSPFGNNPDYFHALAPDNDPDYSANVPNNWLGSQPSIDGDAYIMLHMAPNQIREYAAVELLEPLEKGQEYQISFYTAKIPNPYPHIFMTACNGQGVLFEMNRRSHVPDSLITEPHFYNPTIMITQQNWRLVEGTFIADSSYQYMLLGNFLSLTDPRFKSNFHIPSNYSGYVTYYFDKFELKKTSPDRKFSIDYDKENTCFPVTVSFTPNNVNPSNYWRWTFPDGSISYDEISQKTFNEPGTYTINLATREGGKTYYYSKTITLEQQPLPFADFKTNERLAMNSPIQFENLSENAVYFEWDFGDGNTSTETNPWHTYTQPNDYIVTLIAYNDDDCADTIQYPIYISCAGRMNVNVFTPNNDGRNDDFSFDSLQICDGFHIQIFDRWGRLVFENQDPFRPWDGGSQSSGTYYYIIRYRGGGQEQGYITLIR